MVKDELRKLLNQPYKSDNWKKITEFVFPNVSYLQKPQDIPYVNDKIESFKQIGNVKLVDGKNLAMFEVHVAENVNLASNRVELRKLVAPLIDQERNHGVLVIYEQGKDDYRFTFTAKSTEFDENEGDFKNLETDAKRFTYILGRNESCKTAANRFWELSSNKEKATIKDVEQAFSVERLNKEFFDKYKNFYEDFVQHITGKRFEKENGKWIEKTKGEPIPEHKTVFESDDKTARNFVKLLLGRLVFIQFLQKKGWMGVPATNKKWKGGEKDFLVTLFNSCKDKGSFHTSSLYKLFYNAFNTPKRPNDIFELTGTRVPYLNGGLFENEYPNTDKVNFPAEYFLQLFDFFGQYNFTIDENDPLDHEVGIDPEMLGHIFENLLEDNKDKGAFYTPKPIVQYMCQESLIQYLETFLTENSKWPSDTEKANKLHEGLRNFVKKKTASSIINFDEQIAVALRDVKICDPAIGSGAFPMGILNEIYYCIQTLYNASPDVVGEIWEMENWQADKVKKDIIQNSIYGVDIEKGAVDIARLRFWLSLIVDEKEPSPLPNLDFKIIVGDSLSRINLYQRDIFIEEAIREYEVLTPKYFESADPKEKKQLKDRIVELLATITSGSRNFDFNIYFSDVFHSKKGFDIVIGNPPYIQLQDKTKISPEYLKNIESKNFKVYENTGDIYSLFYEVGFDILKTHGVLCFITSNRFTSTNYGKKLRGFLSTRNLQSIIEFNDLDVFESANVGTIIILAGGNNISKKISLLKVKKEGLNLINPKFQIVHSKYFSSSHWILEREKILKIKFAMEQKGKPLNLIKGLKINRGLTTGSNDVFVLSEGKRNEMVKEDKKCSEILIPVLKGSNIRRWSVIKPDEYLIYSYTGIEIKKYKPVYTYLSAHKKELELVYEAKTGKKKWYELRGCKYYDSFFEKKLVWTRLGEKNRFAITEEKEFSVDSSSFAIGNNLEFYCAILNSKLIHFYFKLGAVIWGETGIKWFGEYFDNIPVIEASDIDKKVLERIKKLVEKLKSCDEVDLIDRYEKELDFIIYRLYEIPFNELTIIDEKISITKEEYEKD
jgi:hypothetical protein